MKAAPASNRRLSSHVARSLLKCMHGRSVLVVGDVMIDEWIWGAATRISPEAPVPVVAVSKHSFTLGGAANVANNLRALGARVSLAGLVGKDDFAARVRELLRIKRIDFSGVVVSSDRHTTRKTRIVAHNQQVVRADWESVQPASARDRARVAAFVAKRAASSDAVIFSDYAKGLLSSKLVKAARSCPVVVADSKPANMKLFKGVTCIAPNVHEAMEAAEMPIGNLASLEKAGRQLLERLQSEYVVVTRGESGMSLFRAGHKRLDIPSVADEIYDVSGAGDTVVAVLALALAAHVSIEQAVQLANFAAGVVVEKLGTATASPNEILRLVAREC